jgi:hypothetical protein
MSEITLQEACERWQRETRSATGYGWYRRHAKYGGPLFGGHGRPYKTGRQWMMRADEVDLAIAAHRAEQALIVQRTEDFRNHVLHGAPGDVIRLTRGHYTVHKGFHCTTISRAVSRPVV